MEYDMVYLNFSSTAHLIFGGNVVRGGVAVMITAEDSLATIHRRLNAIDPTGKRFRNPERLIIMPLPDAGGGVAFVRQHGQVIEKTPVWEKYRKALLAIKDLAVVTFDPLQAFAHCDINADPAAGQFVATMLGDLATETGATVIASHHMRKNGSKPIETPADARECVRGSTALIDGVRLAYALWPVEEKEARKACKILKIDYLSNRIVKGAVIKANDEANRNIQIYARERYGLLQDKTSVLKHADPTTGEDLSKLLTEGIAVAAKNGQPYTRTGHNGVYTQRSRLPEPLQILSRNKFGELVDELLIEKKIVQAMAEGSKSVKWLDVPDGPFAKGEGVFIEGAISKDAEVEDVAPADTSIPQ
jgi:hypothetical protein